MTLTDDDVFTRIARERRGIADLVESLDDARLAAPSLCGEWTVEQVAGHLVVPLTVPRGQVAVAMLRARGSFGAANDRLARDTTARLGRDGVVTTLRRRASSRFTPPGNGPRAPLTEVLVHGQDIRRPLGIERTFEPEELRTVLDLLVSPYGRRGFVAKGRLDGLRFTATDLDWAGGGDGLEVRGPAEALMVAMTGRPHALPDLDGEGISVLSARVF